MDDAQPPQHPSAPHPAAAATLGDYVLGERLERRAAADVYAARHAHKRGPRLVYVLRPGAMQDEPLVHRVVCEADAAHWMRHPAVAKVEAYGDTPSRRLYVAVERPSGRTLADVLAERGALAPPTLVRLAYRLVEALDEAHALGLAHGHLTAAAVVVADALDLADATGAPLVTLTGLGVAAVRHGGESGAEPDVRADVAGLASLLHHALTGAPVGGPAAGATPHARAVAVLTAAHAADPSARPASVKALWDDFLAALVGGESSDALRDAAARSALPATREEAMREEVVREMAARPVAVREEPRLATPPSVTAAPAPRPGRRRVWEVAATAVGVVGIGLSLAHGTVLRAGTPTRAAAGAPAVREVRPTAGAAAKAEVGTAVSAVVGAAASTIGASAAGEPPNAQPDAQPNGREEARAGMARVSQARKGVPAHGSSTRESSTREAPTHASASGELRAEGGRAGRARGAGDAAVQPLNVPSVIVLEVGGGSRHAMPAQPEEFKHELDSRGADPHGSAPRWSAPSRP